MSRTPNGVSFRRTRSGYDVRWFDEPIGAVTRADLRWDR